MNRLRSKRVSGCCIFQKEIELQKGIKKLFDPKKHFES